MRFFDSLLDILYPRKCAFCGALLEKTEAELCARCRKELPWSRHKRKKTDFVRSVSFPLYYEGQVREGILRYKFRGAQARGIVFGRLIAQELSAEDAPDFELISWVPVSRKRERKRGYDQARILAENAGKCLGVPAVSLLEKVRDVPPQSRLNTASARRANVSGCYAVTEPALVEGKKILLIDDVFTTGATLSECARMLMLSGAEEVSAATLAARRKDTEKLEPHEVI